MVTETKELERRLDEAFVFLNDIKVADLSDISCPKCGSSYSMKIDDELLEIKCSNCDRRS